MIIEPQRNVTDSIVPPSVLKPFHRMIEVKPEHTDPLGHVNNLTYLQWFGDIAVDHSASLGYDWDTYKNMGCCFVVRRHELDYFLPTYVGQTLRLTTWIKETTRICAFRTYILTRPEDGKTIASGLTQWVFMNLKTHRPTAIPQEILTAFAEAIESRGPQTQ